MKITSKPVNKTMDVIGLFAVILGDIQASLFVIAVVLLFYSIFNDKFPAAEIIPLWVVNYILIGTGVTLTALGAIHYFRWYVWRKKLALDCPKCQQKVIATRKEVREFKVEVTPWAEFYVMRYAFWIQIYRPRYHYICPTCGHEEYICPYCHKPIGKDDEKCPHCAKRVMVMYE